LQFWAIDPDLGMHELSIAREIATIVCEVVAPHERSRIRTITVDVGAMSGVVPDSLAFCFEAIADELRLPPRALRVRRIDFRCSCRACCKEFTSDLGLVICPSCGGTDTEVRSGRELRVATIDVEEPLHGSP
jgi:hydrogenase nickel incorporation protein HypA/HybF